MKLALRRGLPGTGHRSGVLSAYPGDTTCQISPPSPPDWITASGKFGHRNEAQFRLSSMQSGGRDLRMTPRIKGTEEDKMITRMKEMARGTEMTLRKKGMTAKKNFLQKLRSCKSTEMRCRRQFS